MKKLVLASGNPGKLREFRQMLAPLGFEVVPQAELGISEAEEPHATFVENALAKARHAAAASGLPAFADDSGICVAALGGAPGVQSARYAGPPPAGSAGGVRTRMRATTRSSSRRWPASADRRAHYYCVIVLVRHAADPEPLIAEGRWHGEVIADAARHERLRLRSLFLLPELGRTAAELAPDEKNAISHRGSAQSLTCFRNCA